MVIGRPSKIVHQFIFLIDGQHKIDGMDAKWIYDMRLSNLCFAIREYIVYRMATPDLCSINYMQ